VQPLLAAHRSSDFNGSVDYAIRFAFDGLHDAKAVNPALAVVVGPGGQLTLITAAHLNPFLRSLRFPAVSGPTVRNGFEPLALA
jgi:NAD(P)H-dependent FMN reductase